MNNESSTSPTNEIVDPTLQTAPNETYVINFNYLCGASNPPFFDQSQSWDTLDPDVSACFRKTVLLWVPCAYFWLCLPIRLKQIMKLKGRLGAQAPGRISVLSICKTMGASWLILLAIIDLAFAISGMGTPPSGEIAVADIVDPTLRILTFCAVIGLLQGERLNGFITSWIQFFFWLLFLIGGAISLYSYIRGFDQGTVTVR